MAITSCIGSQSSKSPTPSKEWIFSTRRMGVYSNVYAKTPGKFDLVIENDDFEVCFSKIVEFLTPYFEAIRNKAARLAQFPCNSHLQAT